jgi:hypothetical protein
MIGLRVVRAMSKSAVCVAFVLMAPVSALAHHAAAMYETEKDRHGQRNRGGIRIREPACLALCRGHR